MSNNLGVTAVLLTGTVGSRKTATAVAIGELLHSTGEMAVVVDLDWLGWTYLGADSPAPDEMIAKNLSAIWPNFVAAGMRYAVLARGMTSRSSLQLIKEAIPDADVQVVRLTAAPGTIEARLRGRDTGAELATHMREAAEMASLMEQLQLEEFVVSSDATPVEVVAADIVGRLGWTLQPT